MIHTSKQLKDKVRNVSKGDNNIAKTLISDTTVKALPLNEEDARRIISEICMISIEDGVKFKLHHNRAILFSIMEFRTGGR